MDLESHLASQCRRTYVQLLELRYAKAELKMYLDYLNNEIATVSVGITAGQLKKWNSFKKNLGEGIDYYQSLFSVNGSSENGNDKIQYLLRFYKEELLNIKIPSLEVA